MTLERRSDGATTDVAMKSTSSQHVPTPIGEHSFIISSQCYLKIISIVSAYLVCFVCYAMCLVFYSLFYSRILLFSLLRHGWLGTGKRENPSDEVLA